MSHQSGITANDSLREKFANIKDGHVRVIVIVIENETLVAKEERNVEGTFDEDFDAMIPSLIQPNRPAFYFIRLDTISEISGHNWLLIVYIPDETKVRERMLYASTAATLKRDFGSANITEEIRATSINEMTVNSFHQHLRSQAAPAPLTKVEEEKNEIRKQESSGDVSIATKHNTLRGLVFPFDENVIEKLNLFQKENLDYIQMEIDHTKELILLSHSESDVTPEQIQKLLPENAGRYHLYRFKHDFNNDTLASTIFVYSIPGSGTKKEQRMLYPSCKARVIDEIEKTFGIPLDRKLEISDVTDLTKEFLFQELHPEVSASAASTPFTKPIARPARGPRRLIKTTDNTAE